jgi:hypothetical protein
MEIVSRRGSIESSVHHVSLSSLLVLAGYYAQYGPDGLDLLKDFTVKPPVTVILCHSENITKNLCHGEAVSMPVADSIRQGTPCLLQSLHPGCLDSVISRN